MCYILKGKLAVRTSGSEETTQQAMAAQRAAARAEHRNMMAQEGLPRAVPV